MTDVTEPFVLSPEQQVLVLSALNAYLYEKRAKSGRANIYGKLIAEIEQFHDELFEHHYHVPFMRK